MPSRGKLNWAKKLSRVRTLTRRRTTKIENPDYAILEEQRHAGVGHAPAPASSTPAEVFSKRPIVPWTAATCVSMKSVMLRHKVDPELPDNGGLLYGT